MFGGHREIFCKYRKKNNYIRGTASNSQKNVKIISDHQEISPFGRNDGLKRGGKLFL